MDSFRWLLCIILTGYFVVEYALWAVTSPKVPLPESLKKYLLSLILEERNCASRFQTNLFIDASHYTISMIEYPFEFFRL